MRTSLRGQSITPDDIVAHAKSMGRKIPCIKAIEWAMSLVGGMTSAKSLILDVARALEICAEEKEEGK